MKKVIFYSLCIPFFMTACAQSPVLKTYVYSRITIPGMRPEQDKDNNIFPKTFYIYTEVKKGTTPTTEGCWIEGKYYTVTSMEKVTSPVIVNNQSVVKQDLDTLVKKTSNDVYHLIPGEEKPRTAASDEEKKMVEENKFVLLLKTGGKLQLVPVAAIKELSPAAMM